MATYYNGWPTLVDRVRAVSLIGVGLVETIEPLKRERLGEVDKEQAIARVALDDVLKGASERMSVAVRFIVPEPKSDRAALHALREGQRVVLMLVPDVGRKVDPNTFIAYFEGHFAFARGETFEVPDGPGAKKTTAVTLKALRQMIKAVTAADESERRAWSKYEPQLLAEPRISTITEMPRPESEGQRRSSAPLPARRQPSSTSKPSAKRKK